MCGSERRLRARRRKRTTSIRLQKPIAARTVSRFRGAHCALQCIIDSWQKLRRRRRRRIRYVLIAVCAFDVDVRRRCGLRTHVRVCTMLCCSRFWTHTHTQWFEVPPPRKHMRQPTNTHTYRPIFVSNRFPRGACMRSISAARKQFGFGVRPHTNACGSAFGRSGRLGVCQFAKRNKLAEVQGKWTYSSDMNLIISFQN